MKNSTFKSDAYEGNYQFLRATRAKGKSFVKGQVVKSDVFGDDSRRVFAELAVAGSVRTTEDKIGKPEAEKAPAKK